MKRAMLTSVVLLSSASLWADNIEINLGTPVLASSSCGDNVTVPCSDTPGAGGAGSFSVSQSAMGDSGGYLIPGGYVPGGVPFSSVTDWTFSLPSPADVAINYLVDFQAQGTQCPAIGCLGSSWDPNWTMQANYTIDAQILQGSKVVGDVPLSNSGSNASGDYSGWISLSGAQGGSFQLAAGDYTFQISLAGFNSAQGDNSMSLDLSGVVSDPPGVAPVPEPGCPMLIGLVGAGMFGLKRLRNFVG
ncbi:MAG TPA: hypothetical protein VGR71_04910 [Nitrospira sp.]|nr:hypothetical protein [Nitrospira sp.]